MSMLFDYCKKNWVVLKSAPLVFGSAAILAFITAYGASSWWHSERINDMEAALNKCQAYAQSPTYPALQPICLSESDTEKTKKQVRAYNAMGKQLKIPSFKNMKFCEEVYKSTPD